MWPVPSIPDLPQRLRRTRQAEARSATAALSRRRLAPSSIWARICSLRSTPASISAKAGTRIRRHRRRPPNRIHEKRREASSSTRRRAQVRGYDRKDRRLVIADPRHHRAAEELPSPSGTYKVRGIARHPIYYYDPDKNFVQGDNKEKLKLPPGPNNPVGIRLHRAYQADVRSARHTRSLERSIRRRRTAACA